MEIVRLTLAVGIVLITQVISNETFGQGIQVVGRSSITGRVIELKPGLIEIQQKDGKLVTCKIQDKDEQAISIGGNATRVPCKISVTGNIETRLIEKGMIVHFFGQSNAYGKTTGEITNLVVLDRDASDELKVDFLERPPTPRDAAKVEVIGRVVNLSANRLQLQVPKAKWSKKERIVFTTSNDSVLEFDDDNLNRVQPDDIVRRAVVLELSNGEKVISEIDVYFAADRTEITTSYHGKLEQEFSHISDSPGEPREIRSDHFVLHTDVSDRNAKILLAKLETMYNLIGGYYSARPTAPIVCYVVRDLRKWPRGQLPARGIAKIAEPAGVTLTVKNGATGQTAATVYSCDKHGVVQHEAVHSFCAQTFGKVGPVWYAEGMAEMGQYWKPGESRVNIDPVVIDYLTNATPKKMSDIDAAGQITGDSWQAYAWRWALCHMLATNPNYSRRFKKLGLNMMTGKEDSFENAFGKVAGQISFEYDQFVKHLDNGYRSDLCAWDWRTKAANITSDQRLKKIVKAKKGWQATKLKTRSGVKYQFVTQGKWATSSRSDEIDADGHPDGSGKMIGMVFDNNLKIGKPFELGTKGTFVAEEGQLFVRCRDDWNRLSDNDGQVTLYVRRAQKEE